MKALLMALLALVMGGALAQDEWDSHPMPWITPLQVRMQDELAGLDDAGVDRWHDTLLERLSGYEDELRGLKPSRANCQAGLRSTNVFVSGQRALAGRGVTIGRSGMSQTRRLLRRCQRDRDWINNLSNERCNRVFAMVQDPRGTGVVREGESPATDEEFDLCREYRAVQVSLFELNQ